MNELDANSRHDDYADDSAHKSANQYLNIGVVVVICASRDWDVLIGHFDVFCVGLQIFWRDHDHETHRFLVFEQLVAPSVARK